MVKKALDQEFNLSLLLLQEIPETEMNEFLISRCTSYRVLSIGNRNRGNRYNLFVSLKANYSREEFMQELNTHAGFESIQLERSDNLTRL